MKYIKGFVPIWKKVLSPFGIEDITYAPNPNLFASESIPTVNFRCLGYSQNTLLITRITGVNFVGIPSLANRLGLGADMHRQYPRYRMGTKPFSK
jgi:hypothetical protein